MVKQKLSVLVGCEFSGTMRDAFIQLGHAAMSCDLLPSDVPGPHYQGDVRDILHKKWDLAIFHPDCTYLCSSGLHWNLKRPERAALTEEALDFVRFLLEAPIPHIALENSMGCISTRIREATQYVQPYEFGDDASKKTGLWLKNLPPLTPTLRVPGRVVGYRKSGQPIERWANQTDSGQNKLAPSQDRWKLRSKTYAGIAKAAAEQWSRYILNKKFNTNHE